MYSSSSKLLLALILAAGTPFSCSKDEKDTSPEKGPVQKIRQCTPQIAASYRKMLEAHFREKRAVDHGNTLTRRQWMKLDASRREKVAKRLIRPVMWQIIKAKRQKLMGPLFRNQYNRLRGCFEKDTCEAFGECFARATQLAYLGGIETRDLFGAAKEEPAATRKDRPGARPREQASIDAGGTAGDVGAAPGGSDATSPTDEPSAIQVTSETYDLKKREPKLDLRPLTRGSLPSAWIERGAEVAWVTPRGSRLHTKGRVDLSSYGAALQMAKGSHGQVLIQTSKALLMVPRSLEPIVVWKPKRGESVGSMWLHDDHVYIGTGGDLVILSSKLEQLARLDLKIKRKGKEVHDIFVQDGQAYLLDNRRVPVLIFRADVAAPAKPKVLQRIWTSGTYAHLTHQWVGKRSKRWAIVKETSNRSGSYQQVMLLDSMKPNPDQLDSNTGNTSASPDSKGGYSNDPFGDPHPAILHEKTLYSRRSERVINFHSRQTGKKLRLEKEVVRHDGSLIKGHKLLACSKTSPFWGVFRRAGKVYVGKLRTKTARVYPMALQELDATKCLRWVTPKNTTKRKCLHSKTPRKASLGHSGGWVVAAVGDKLFWISAKAQANRKPTVVKTYETQRRRDPPLILVYP